MDFLSPFVLLRIINSHQAWSLETYDPVLSVHAHKESVLGLSLSDDGNLLFSSGGDSVVNVSLTTFHSRGHRLHGPKLIPSTGLVDKDL